ncbi:TPA: hypothetical protein ACX6QO_001385 [Photobacterium damselae]
MLENKKESLTEQERASIFRTLDEARTDRKSRKIRKRPKQVD